MGIFFNAWITIGQNVWGKTYKDFSYEGTAEKCISYVNSTVVQNSTIKLSTVVRNNTVELVCDNQRLLE